MLFACIVSLYYICPACFGWYVLFLSILNLHPALTYTPGRLELMVSYRLVIVLIRIVFFLSEPGLYDSPSNALFCLVTTLTRGNVSYMSASLCSMWLPPGSNSCMVGLLGFAKFDNPSIIIGSAGDVRSWIQDFVTLILVLSLTVPL